MRTHFGQMIAMKLRAAKKTRIKLPARLRNSRWLWPSNAERKYQSLIREAIQGFAEALYPSAEVIAQRWGAKAHDGAGDDLAGLNDEIERLSAKFFGSDLAGKIADVGNEMDVFAGDQFNRFSDLAIGQRWDPMDSKSKQAVRDWSLNNYKLVQSLPAEHVRRLNQIITDGVQNGRIWTDIAKDVRGIGDGLTRQKAQLIARDQLGKLNGALEKAKMQDAGIDYYTWCATLDDRTRDGHAAMDGMVCRYDDDTVYSDDGGNTWKKRTAQMPKGIPGFEIQCRCTAAPFMDPLFKEAAEEVDMEFDPDPVARQGVNVPTETRMLLESSMQKIEKIVEMSNTPYPDIPFKKLTQDIHSEKVLSLAKSNPGLVEKGVKAGYEYMRDSSAFNAPLRSGVASLEVKEKAADLADLIMANRIDYKIFLCRGISHGSWSVGDVIENDGFSSFSSDEQNAVTMTKGKKPKYLLRWIADAGEDVAPLCVGIDGVSVEFNTKEREFLGVPEMDFEVVGMKTHPSDPELVILDVRRSYERKNKRQ